jgi:hypothetical protein
MKLKSLLITLFICSLGWSQNRGKISGVILDKDLNNEPLGFANITLKGTSIGTSTNIEGKYTIEVAAGTYTLVISFLGYETVEIPCVVKENEITVVNKTIGSGSVSLSDVVVKSTVNREKETALLLEQKNAIEIKQSIGAQELSRKGVSDAATAITKTTGITKQEGSGNIFVRGLGDRYNSTTMNGIPVPSNDPEKKNLNLEIFNTDIIESIGINKVYNSKLYGDFAGGNVDIVSKEYKGKGFLKVDVGSKGNSNALTDKEFKLKKGYSKLGFDKFEIPNNSLTQYNYSSLQLETQKPIASSFTISGGKSYQIGSEGKLSLFATIGYGNEYNAINNGIAKSDVNGAGVAGKNFNSYTKLNFNTNTTGMVNVGFKLNNKNKFSFNSVFINTSADAKEEYSGYVVDLAENGNGFIRRSTFEKNTVLINQFLGEHQYGERSKLNLGISYNTIKGDMPDRTQNALRKEVNGYVLSSINASDNHRYFQNLKENEIAGNLTYDYKFGKKENEFKGKITFGYNARIKTRDFESIQFNFDTNAAFANTIVDIDNLDGFYNQKNFSNGYFDIKTFRGGAQSPNALQPQTYKGDQSINAGFLNLEYNFNKLTTVVGLRVENIVQKVKWDTQLSPFDNSNPNKNRDELTKIAFLPSLILKYKLTEKQNLRLGASKTYTLPQFKERALFVYEEVLQVKVGNPFLYESDDYNLDLKWELFPKTEEIISFTAFGKYIQNPINEVVIASSTNDISFINTGDYGYVAGAELEYRKQLFNIGEANIKKLSLGFNASYLHSEQELSSEKVKSETDYEVDFTNKKSSFTGASDLLLNADISFFNSWNNKESSLNTTLSFTHFSDRINAIGTGLRGDLVDKAFGSLDFITKIKLTKHFGIDFLAKNVLDPKIQRTQENKNGDVNILSYKKGTTFGLSINYQF